MSDHFIKKCRHCEAVLTQCRCINPYKKVIWGICAKCERELIARLEQADPRRDIISK